MAPVLLVLNAGSSSLKFQVFDAPEHGNARAVFKGLYEGLGGAARFVVRDAEGAKLDESSWSLQDGAGARRGASAPRVLAAWSSWRTSSLRPSVTGLSTAAKPIRALCSLMASFFASLSGLCRSRRSTSLTT